MRCVRAWPAVRHGPFELAPRAAVRAGAGGHGCEPGSLPRVREPGAVARRGARRRLTLLRLAPRRDDSFFRQHLPPAEVSAETLAQVRPAHAPRPGSSHSLLRLLWLAHSRSQGLDNTAARVAPHADACLSRFENWALEHIFARPRSLGSAEAEAARAEEDAAAAFTPQEEMQLDARMHAARCRLAAVRASALRLAVSRACRWAFFQAQAQP